MFEPRSIWFSTDSQPKKPVRPISASFVCCAALCRASLPWFVQDVVCHQSWSVSGVVDMFEPRSIWFSTDSQPKKTCSPHLGILRLLRSTLFFSLCIAVPSCLKDSQTSPTLIVHLLLPIESSGSAWHLLRLPLASIPLLTASPTKMILFIVRPIVWRQWPCLRSLLGHTSFISTCTPFPRQDMNLLSFFLRTNTRDLHHIVEEPISEACEHSIANGKAAGGPPVLRSCQRSITSGSDS